MRKYDNTKQEKVFELSDEFQAALKKLNELAPTLDHITLPLDLIELINNDVQESKYEESKEESENKKDSILKKYHEELSDRVLYSTQLGRGTNKSMKKFERQMRKKAKVAIKEILN